MRKCSESLVLTFADDRMTIGPIGMGITGIHVLRFNARCLDRTGNSPVVCDLLYSLAGREFTC